MFDCGESDSDHENDMDSYAGEEYEAALNAEILDEHSYIESDRHISEDKNDAQRGTIVVEEAGGRFVKIWMEL